MEGSNIIPDQLIPGSDDTCITDNAPSADCAIYTAQYGEVTQCVKYETAALVYTAAGKIAKW